ncbi:hypothetical protein NDQ71_02400 [Pseudoalteromonas sp. KG3]|uniref:hypothetical protein n=1 Tax=Pseudoalteromonas sp. KG3 TaxID=2951137 RepID=UPI00265988CA|nr:hypothetical protein [Pseudoalteromonas sp. KG3]WKD23969.1 hypothetical protein NDQ71_02400 [Pseudoalteromonas sp. KG3]
MINQEVSQYYFFGTTMRFLQDAKEGWSIRGEMFIYENIKWFFDHLDAINLPVTKRASRPLKDFMRKLEETEEVNLSNNLAHELAQIMNQIRFTLDAEIQGLEAFIITPKRYDVDKLLNDINGLFAPEMFAKFHDIAKVDFIEAGKCIAFERATAAAFHILRATEANLRFYYESMVKQNRIKSRMWGPIVQDLRVKGKTKNYIALNNHLDNIRVSFRNPTQHPEALYDIHEVQDLLSVCIDVNNRMFKVINA